MAAHAVQILLDPVESIYHSSLVCLLLKRCAALGKTDAALEIRASIVLPHVDNANDRRKGNLVVISIQNAACFEACDDTGGRLSSQRDQNKDDCYEVISAFSSVGVLVV
jgi:hypothetical protein